MEEERLKKLQYFFAADIKIKKEIYNMAPVMYEEYLDDTSINKYVDELNDSLNYMISELKEIIIDTFGKNSIVYIKVCNLGQTIKKKFYNCNYDMNKLKQFYHEYISNMEEDFINSTKKECVGYTFNGIETIKKATTINEVLHFIHSYIVNNDIILNSIPLLKEKENNNGYKISLRGISNPIFDYIFNMFPLDLDCGITDIVGVNNNKLIIMVRDRGHALSIEITLSDKIARIEYFIPKLCNIEMINNLPGINKVNESSPGATGVIEVPIESLSSTLFDFISKVPTDADIISNRIR